jgi:hypothetical protein
MTTIQTIHNVHKESTIIRRYAALDGVFDTHRSDLSAGMLRDIDDVLTSISTLFRSTQHQPPQTVGDTPRVLRSTLREQLYQLLVLNDAGQHFDAITNALEMLRQLEYRLLVEKDMN